MPLSWKHPLKALPVLLLLAAYAGAAFGAAGNVQFVIGDVKLITRAGVTSTLQKGAEINEGDRVVTADGASAQIKMVDGGFIAIRPNTDMGFDTYRYSGKEDGTENAIVSLVQGGFRTITGIIGRTNKQNYLVKTATATIGIRGTDHEPMVILAPRPGQAAIAAAGIYDKVNVGIAFIRNDAGSVDIHRNQVGFAPETRVPPVVLPRIPPFYKPTPAPGPQKAAAPEEKAAEPAAQIRDTAIVDPTSTVSAASAATTVASAPAALAPVVAITATDASGTILNTTTQTATTSSGTTTPIVPPPIVETPPIVPPPIVETPPIAPGTTVPTGGPFAAFAPSNTAVEIATPFFSSQGNSMAAPADLVFVDGGLSSFTDRDIGGGSSNSFSVIGGSAPVTANANSFATTGVQFGRWSSATGLQASFTQPLGAQSGAPTTWIYGPQGYLDSPGVELGVNTGPLTGTFNYALDGSTAPYDRRSGTSGTLTSASVSADFTNQTASASLALNVGGQAWSAATTTPVNFGFSNIFSASSFPGQTSNNLTVSMGAGTPAACPTCFGNLTGAFTGQNYAGAILSYNLGDNGNAGGDIVGHAALARTGAAIANGTTPATGQYFVGDFGGGIQFADTLSTPGGVLTSFGSGSAALAANGFFSTTVNCTTCTVTAATNATTAAAPTGVFFGTWDAGTFTNTFGVAFGETLFGQNPHWITGPEPGPLFLANALIGTKSFAFDGGMVTNLAGVTGTVLPTTALAVDFTKQVVGINLDLSINDTAPTPTPHTWNAKTLPGNEAVLDSGKGLGGAAFRASSFNGTGPGLLTVTVDGTTPGSGNVSGQLTGTGLNGAIMSYDLNAALIAGPASPTFEQVNGVTAFLGATSDVATPYRLVMISTADPSSIINQPVLGFYPNNPTRMLTDAAGNLTQFDMSQINDRGNSNGNGNASVILSSGTSVLTDQGSDPATGIRWGRWAGGSINITDRIDGTIKTQPLAGSLHWIAGPAETAAVTLPVSGTFTYVSAGGTAPTDNRGNVGTLNSATLTANFTTQTVNVGVQTTIAGATLGGSASAVPIIQRTAFAAGPDMPVNLSVSCTGVCGTTHRGTIVGGFTGAGATGAAMMYALEKVGGANASVTSGVAAFRR